MKPDLGKNPTPLLKGATYFQAPIEWIQPDRSQPRQVFSEEELADLAESIRQRGMLHPIAVRHAAAKNRFTIVAGERRYRAAKKAGLSVIPCQVIVGELTEVEILGLQLTENIHREELKPVEEAEAFQRLMTLQGWNRKQLGEFLGICPSGITRRFSLLKLSGAIKVEVEAGNLPRDTAYFISQLQDPLAEEDLARRAVQDQLPRAAVAAEVRQALGKPKGINDTKNGDQVRADDTRTRSNKGISPVAGQSRPTTTGHVSPPSPSKKPQRLFNISKPEATVLVEASAPPLRDADVFAILQEALLEASKSHLRQASEQTDSSMMQVIQEILGVLRAEEQVLAAELEDLTNLVALLIVNKLGNLLKNKFGAGAAAQRALNRLGETTQKTIGVLLEGQAVKKTK